ncbi:pentatricopeptide repeat-containing protein At3g22470, mitochondrial-like [Chenopodium quinoa]|uniref:pentatricopeptide repeat-containing protein At3g22470, mitochondrial-like n=1 Tax=Chenopodium quinoa TaxID=63459 RepID=UPI000B797FE4|nr:pentatricopeptide repeat-containing protein At3g22470, mitochondrial-like [Chenopodium quinoa]
MRFPAFTFSLFLHHHHHRRQKIRQLAFSLFYSITAKPNYQPPIKTTQSYPNHFIPQFFSFAKTLTQNPRNFKALSQLDFLLSHSKLFDSVTSVAIIEGLCRLKKLNRAKAVFLHLKDNLKVSPYFAFNLVFDCMFKDEKLDDVEVQWGEISNGYEINLTDYVIYVCKCGDLDEIKNVCERILMGTRVLGRQSYVALVGVLCRYNEGSVAKSVLHEMYCRGFRVDDVTYIVLFQCLCRNGDLDAADWVLRKMVKGGVDVDVCVYGSFMHGLCKEGKFREARKLFDKLIKRDGVSGSEAEFLKERRRAIFQLNYKGEIPEMMVYETYLRCLCAVGKLDDAELLLKKMMKKRSMAQVCVYGSFIKALFRAGREEDALKFFHVECKKGLVCSDELARYVFVQQCNKGEVDSAMKIFDELSRKGAFINTVIHCYCLLSSLWGAGRILEAERYFDRMNHGDLAPPNLATYRLMVCGFCNETKRRKALDIFEEMLSKNIPIDKFICEALLTSLCNQGWHAEAYRYLDTMTRSGSLVSYTVWKRMFYSLVGYEEQLFD